MRKIFLCACLLWSHTLLAMTPDANVYSSLLREGSQPLNVDYEWRSQRQQLSLQGRQWWKLLRALDDGRWDAEALDPVKHQLPLTLSCVQMESARRVQAPIAGVELLERFGSFRRLRTLVEAELRRSDGFYFPSALMHQGTGSRERMHEWEDQLFLRWSAFTEVELDLAGGAMPELIGKLSEKTIGEPREVFDHLLELVVNSREDQLWAEFRQRIEGQLLAERSELMKALLPPLQALLKQRIWAEAKPERLRVELPGDGLAVPVGAPIEVNYSYQLHSDVPHQVFLSLRRTDGTIIEQKQLTATAHSGSCQLRALRKAGNYEVSLSVHTRYGWQALRDASLLVTGESGSEDQKELLSTFVASLRRRADQAKERLALLAAQQRDVERQLQLATPAIDAMEEQLAEDNAYSSAVQIQGKWLRSGRYDAYLGQLERYNQLVDESERIEAQGEILDSQRKQQLDLAERISQQVKTLDLDLALNTALESSYADELGYTKRLEAFITRAPELQLSAQAQSPTRELQRQFVRAILANDLKEAGAALTTGIDINRRDPYTGEHILHLYLRAANPQLETVRFLIAKGANAQATDAQGNGLSPLMVLALSTGGGKERKEILHYLIDLGLPFSQEALSKIQHKEALIKELETADAHPYLFDEGLNLLREATR